MFDVWLVDQIALESIRVERCQQQEQALRTIAAERAATCWDLDRAVDWMDTYIPASPGQRAKSLPTWIAKLPSRHIADDVQISAAR